MMHGQQNGKRKNYFFPLYIYIYIYIYYNLLSPFCENIAGNIPSVLVVVFFSRDAEVWGHI